MNLLRGAEFLWMELIIQYRNHLLLIRVWYSHKFKGPGVQYEVAISVESAQNSVG